MHSKAVDNKIQKLDINEAGEVMLDMDKMWDQLKSTIKPTKAPPGYVTVKEIAEKIGLTESRVFNKIGYRKGDIKNVIEIMNEKGRDIKCYYLPELIELEIF